MNSAAGFNLLFEAISEFFADCWVTYTKIIIATT